MSKRIKLSSENLLKELNDTTDHITLLLSEILEKQKTSLVKPLSVDLRKLHSPTQGDDLLRRVEHTLQIKLSFPDRSKRLPPTIIEVGLDEYRDGLVFALQGRKFSRLKLINLVAGQKGAHTDDFVE